jgi:hypothetical protein
MKLYEGQPRTPLRRIHGFHDFPALYSDEVDSKSREGWAYVQNRDDIPNVM